MSLNSRPDWPGPRERRFELSNGVPVSIIPATSGVGAVCILVTSGSRDEASDEIGALHLLEHVVMRSRLPGRGHAGEYIGRLGGDANAATSKEYMLFQARSADTMMPRVSACLSEAVGSLRITKDTYAAELAVALEELRLAAADPGDVVQDLFFGTAFDEHALGRPVGGYSNSIADLSLERILQIHQDVFTADRILINVVSNQPVAAFEQALNKSPIAQLPRAPARSRPRPPPSIVPPQVMGFQNVAGDYAYVVVGGIAAPGRSEQRAAWEVFASHVAGHSGSVLARLVRSSLGLAYDVFGWYTPYSDTGVWRVRIGTGPENIAEVLGACHDALARLSAEISDRALGAARTVASRQSLLMADGVLERLTAITVSRYVEQSTDWTPEQNAQSMADASLESLSGVFRAAASNVVAAVAGPVDPFMASNKQTGP